MSLHFLLDAYNIIYQIPSLAKGSLEEQRKKLIDFIDVKRPQGSLKNGVTIVFDGQPHHFHEHKARTAKVVFSAQETADEKICRLVDAAKNRKNMIVVTNDRAVQYAVRALGAKVLKVQDFVAKGDASLVKNKPSSAQKRNKSEMPKEISKADELNINTELESFWLKKKR